MAGEEDEGGERNSSTSGAFQEDAVRDVKHMQVKAMVKGLVFLLGRWKKRKKCLKTRHLRLYGSKKCLFRKEFFSYNQHRLSISQFGV